MQNTNLVETLKKILATKYALYLKTQGFHWAVTGPSFYTLHTAFQTQYEDLQVAIDDTAERLRAIGAQAPAGFAAYSELSVVKDASGAETAQEMVSALHADHKALASLLKDGIAVAESAEDPVSVDFLTQRLTVHEKTLWMMQSYLG